MLIDEKLINDVFLEAEQSPRRRAVFCFHESTSDNAQRLLNVMLPETKIPIHRHPQKTETYILVMGKVEVLFYDQAGKVTDVFMLERDRCKNFGLHIPKMQWHTLRVLEPSVIFEVSDGPYYPIDKNDIYNL